MEIIGYIGALCIGLVLGLTGGGGSMLTLPILVYIMSIEPVVATAYSLFIVGITSSFGAIQNYNKNLVDINNGFLFAIPSFIAVYLTRKYIVSLIPNQINLGFLSLQKGTFLMILFAIIMFYASISMLYKKNNKIQNNSASTYILVIQTFFIGIVIGLVGAGGGFLIIPSLVIFAKLPMKKAIGTSLFIIAINSLIGFLGDVQNLNINWIFLLTFTLISITGIFIGIYFSKYFNEQQLKKGFAYFVLSMAIFIMVKELL